MKNSLHKGIKLFLIIPLLFGSLIPQGGTLPFYSTLYNPLAAWIIISLKLHTLILTPLLWAPLVLLLLAELVKTRKIRIQTLWPFLLPLLVLWAYHSPKVSLDLAEPESRLVEDDFWINGEEAHRSWFLKGGWIFKSQLKTSRPLAVLKDIDGRIFEIHRGEGVGLESGAFVHLDSLKGDSALFTISQGEEESQLLLGEGEDITPEFQLFQIKEEGQYHIRGIPWSLPLVYGLWLFIGGIFLIGAHWTFWVGLVPLALLMIGVPGGSLWGRGLFSLIPAVFWGRQTKGDSLSWFLRALWAYGLVYVPFGAFLDDLSFFPFPHWVWFLLVYLVLDTFFRTKTGKGEKILLGILWLLYLWFVPVLLVPLQGLG